jgi:adenosylmethionine---8-amino-7-oxononanoate aminotransferase
VVSPEKLTELDKARVWLRPFRDLIYTMPPYVSSDDDVAASCAGVLAAVAAVTTR